MSNTLRIKRRAAGGAAGAPASLANAELAYNEQDNILYYGFGTGGAGGTATSATPIGGPGAFLGLSHAGSGGTAHAAATGAAAGFMSAADKAKLDGISSPTTIGTAMMTLPNPSAVTFARFNADNTVSALDAATFRTAIGAGISSLVLASTTPAALGTAAVGSGTTAAKADHVHAMPTFNQVLAPTAAVDFNAQRLTGLAEPTGGADAATKNYVDLARQGLSPKTAVRVATTAAGTLASSFANASVVDGVTLATGDRILIKDQAAPAENGIYTVNASGAPTRADDASTWAELVSAYFFVSEGTVNADIGFVCTSNSGGTLGSTAVTFGQFSGAGQIIAGAGMTKTGNQLDIGAGTGITVGADSVGLTGQALALHNLGTNGLIARTAAGTVAARAVAVSGAGLSVANADGVAGNPTVSLTAQLAAVGGLTAAADLLAYFTGASTAATTTLTAFARSLLAAAGAAAARTTLGLGSMATQNASAVAITGGTVDGITLDGGTF